MSTDDIASRLSSAFDRNICVMDRELIERASIDAWGMYAGSAAVVVRPRTVDEVAAIVRWCHENGIAIVPQGGNTGLAGGATPDNSGQQVVLSLSRLNRIRDVDPINYTATVEAGCILSQVQDAAKDADRIFPMSFGAEGSCQIGGVLSTNAGGSNTLRYGTARDLVLGLEVVLADGSIWHGLRKLRKDNTGYDLRHLFIGAEGTLGIITAAVLKLFPAPRSRETVLVALADLTSSVKLLALAREVVGESVSAFELMSNRFVHLVHEHVPGAAMPPAQDKDWFVLIEFDAVERGAALGNRVQELLELALEQGVICDAAVAANIEQRNRFWRLREGVSEAQLHNGAVIYADVSVAVSSVPQFIADATDEVKKIDSSIDVNAFGHVGDGNIHFNLLQPKNRNPEAFLEMKRAYESVIFKTVQSYGGSVSAEHGIGQSKVQVLMAHKSEVELEMMRRIRATLAQSSFNPDKVIPIK